VYVINIVNSIISKPGNIGVRTGKIIEELNHKNIKNISFSRGCKEIMPSNKNMSLFGNIARLLNAYRIYVNPRYNHRIIDIWLFDIFVSVFSPKIIEENTIVHLWEFSPKIIRNFKEKGCFVLLDVPIAPSSTTKTLKQDYANTGLQYHEKNDCFEKQSFELADHIVVPSIFVKKELIKSGVLTDKITINYFGSNHSELTKIDDFSNKNSKKAGIDFCFAGIINSRKGVETLLAAWDTHDFKVDRLHLCGRLTPQISKLLLEYSFDNIVLPGFINTHDYFKKCDVYVFPSLLEGSSKSIYEAMQSGLPVITTFNSGSIVRDEKDGYIINICNEEQLRNKMLILKHDDEIRMNMSKSAYEYSKSFTWSSYAKETIKLYEDLLGAE